MPSLSLMWAVEPKELPTPDLKQGLNTRLIFLKQYLNKWIADVAKADIAIS